MCFASTVLGETCVVAPDGFQQCRFQLNSLDAYLEEKRFRTENRYFDCSAFDLEANTVHAARPREAVALLQSRVSTPPH